MVIILLITVLGCNQGSDKKITKIDKSLKGTVLFTFGTVSIIDKDGTSRKIKVKDIVVKGQTIKTGPKAFVTLQVGKIAVIKIKEKSLVVYNDVSSDLITSLNLKKGSLLTKINKLQKGKSFSVYTDTLLAAVRGTEFIISSEGKKTQISLKQGKLAIRPLKKAEKEEIKEKINPHKDEIIVSEGKTVTAEPKKDQNIIEKNDIKERNITKEEKLEVEKISIVPIVKNPEKISEKELIKIQKETKKKEDKINKKLVKVVYQNKVTKIIQKKTRTIVEMKQVFTRVSRFVLYNGRKIEGAVLYRRGNSITILTRYGKVNFSKSDIQNEIPL